MAFKAEKEMWQICTDSYGKGFLFFTLIHQLQKDFINIQLVTSYFPYFQSVLTN